MDNLGGQGLWESHATVRFSGWHSSVAFFGILHVLTTGKQHKDSSPDFLPADLSSQRWLGSAGAGQLVQEKRFLLWAE